MDFEVKDSIVRKTLTFHDTLEFYRNLPNYQWKNPKNASWAAKLYNNDRSEWSGGSVEDIFAPANLAPMLAAQERFRREMDSRTLSTQVGWENKRKRALSEHDGEWDLGRQWEVAPFSNTVKTKTYGRIVSLYVDYSIHCGHTAEEINNFAVVLWNLITYLETLGYSTEVRLIDDCTEGMDGPVSRWCLETILKHSSEYLHVEDLAKALSSNFYRRAMFSVMAAAGDSQRTMVHYALGACNSSWPPDVTEMAKQNIRIPCSMIKEPFNSLVTWMIKEVDRYATAK